MRFFVLNNRTRSAIMLLIMVILFFAPVGFALASGGGETKGWVKEDSYRVLNFVVLAGGLFFLLRKPVKNALSSRIKGIEDQLKDLEAQKSEAEKTLAEYKEKIATLDKESEKILAQYKEQGEAAKKRILEEAANSAEKLEEQAKRNVEQEFKAAKLKLQEEITSKALLKAEEIIMKSIKPEDQDKLVDEYLNKVVA